MCRLRRLLSNTVESEPPSAVVITVADCDRCHVDHLIGDAAGVAELSICPVVR